LSALPSWIDGRVLPPGDPGLRADDSAFLQGRGCYTTTRIVAGRPLWPERHARRLARDARRLGLGLVEESRAAAALEELGRAAFGEGDGVVRLQASRDAEGRLHLTGIPRPLGPEPETWSAVVSPLPHPGPMPWGGAKVTGRLLDAVAREGAAKIGADEALLVDREGFLVEGTRCNLLFAAGDGALAALPLERGAVAGVAQEIVRERIPDLATWDLRVEELTALRELIAVNAVRGARPIVKVDGRPVGTGRAGPGAERVARALGEI
jgi:branched-subunit amino acid aminotransferase/4-amino-4-deoxychorismate lyase